MSLISRKQERRGVVTVEMAFITPLIFLLVFASIEFGRVLMVTHGLEEAAREGCRKAILAQATADEVKSVVDTRLNTFGISGHTLATDPTQFNTACQFDPVTVKVSVPYSDVSWLPTLKFLSQIQLSASCTLPMESDQCENQ